MSKASRRSRPLAEPPVQSKASRRSRPLAEPPVQSDASTPAASSGASSTVPATPQSVEPGSAGSGAPGDAGAASGTAIALAMPPAAGGSEGAQDGGNATATGGAGDDDNGRAETEGLAEGEMGARPALAPLEAAQLQAQARETLIGTIGEWARSGAREIVRVAGLVAEHGDWTREELDEFAAAFDRVALEAMSSADLMKVQRNAERLLDLSSELEEFGIEQDQVLSISADFRTVVTTDGRKVNFGAPVL